MPNLDVIVVGAGPSGLVAATMLCQRGARVALIDRETRESVHSRASVLWPRSLEILHGVGATPMLLAEGRSIDGVMFHSDGATLGSVDFSEAELATAFPFGLAMSQVVTEGILRQCLARYGGTVRSGVEAVSLRQSANGVEVDYAEAGGATGTLRARWIIAADGSRSTIRDLLGIEFTGPGHVARFAICDAELDSSLSNRMMHYLYTPETAIAVSQFSTGVARLAVGLDRPGKEAPSREFFDSALRSAHPSVRSVGDLLWSAAFTVRFRSADQWRRGDVFLVGDAAHIMSPAGGQGMNTGLQDAANIAWKLGAVIQGADESLLETYEPERMAAAARSMESSAMMAGWSAARTPDERTARDSAIRDMLRTSRSQLAKRIAQLGYEADDGIPSPGGRFPSLADSAETLAPYSSWPAHSQDRSTLFLWPGQSTWATPPQPVGRLAALGSGADVVDLARFNSPRLGRLLGNEPMAFLVRPDGLVEATTDI